MDGTTATARRNLTLLAVPVLATLGSLVVLLAWTALGVIDGPGLARMGILLLLSLVAAFLGNGLHPPDPRRHSPLVNLAAFLAGTTIGFPMVMVGFWLARLPGGEVLSVPIPDALDVLYPLPGFLIAVLFAWTVRRFGRTPSLTVAPPAP